MIEALIQNSILTKEIIVTLHAFGVVLAIGGVVFAHLYALKYLERSFIQVGDYSRFKTIHHFILVGLIISVVSGFLILLYYWYFSPGDLLNVKIYVKITLLGVILYYLPDLNNEILPLIRANIGRFLFDGLSLKTIRRSAFIGGLSITTWFYIFMLGSFRTLNHIATSSIDFVIWYGIYMIPFVLVIIIVYVISLVLSYHIHKNNNSNGIENVDGVTTISNAFLIVDAKTKGFPIIEASRSFYNMTKYNKNDTLGKNCSFLQGAGSDNEVVERIKKSLTLGKTFYGLILNYKKDGSPFWNYLSLRPIYNVKQELIYYSGIQTEVLLDNHQLPDSINSVYDK